MNIQNISGSDIIPKDFSSDPVPKTEETHNTEKQSAESKRVPEENKGHGIDTVA